MPLFGLSVKVTCCISMHLAQRHHQTCYSFFAKLKKMPQWQTPFVQLSTNRCISPDSTALNPHRWILKHPCATSMHLNAPPPTPRSHLHMHQVSPFIVASCAARLCFFKSETNGKCQKTSQKPVLLCVSARLLLHNTLASSDTQHTHTQSNKGFHTLNSTPLSVWGGRGGRGCHGDASPAEANLCGPLVGPGGVDQPVYIQTWRLCVRSLRRSWCRPIRGTECIYLLNRHDGDQS